MENIITAEKLQIAISNEYQLIQEEAKTHFYYHIEKKAFAPKIEKLLEFFLKARKLYAAAETSNDINELSKIFDAIEEIAEKTYCISSEIYKKLSCKNQKQN